MGIFEAIVQGIIQGLTEFLPVSSSGHLSVFQYFTGLSGESGAFFSIVLHLGTLIAVLIAFFPTIFDLVYGSFRMLGDIFTGRFTFKRMDSNRRMIIMLIVSLLPLFAVFFLKDFYESFSTDNDIVIEGICLIITGIMLFFATRCPDHGKDAGNMKYSDSLAMGIAQAIAPMPGISRSGSTISIGMLMGLEKEFAVTFSFIMGIPAVLGAVLLEIPEVMDTGLTLPIPVLLAGLITSAVFGLLAIGLVKKLVVSKKFKWFAYYTLAAGVLITAVGIYERFSSNAIQSFIIGLIK